MASRTNFEGFDRAAPSEILFADSFASAIVKRTRRQPTRQVLNPRRVMNGFSNEGGYVDVIGFNFSSASSRSLS